MQKKLSKEKRDKLILVWVFIIGMSASIWVLLIRPEEARLAQVRQETVNLEDQIGVGTRLLSNRSRFQADVIQLREELEKREAGMAYGDRFYWFVNMINKFRMKYNVEIPQISPEVPTEIGLFPRFPYQSVAFKLSGSATFYDLGKFIADFENTYPYISIRNLKINPAADEKVAFQMEMLTLIKPDNS